MALTFLTESTRDFRETESVGSFARAASANNFGTIFETAASDLDSKNIDVMRDINALVGNKAMMECYKDGLLSSLRIDCETHGDDDHMSTIYEQVSTLWDNTVSDFVKESQSVGQLLPIKAVDLPIIVKQHVQAISKEIMQTEVVKSPVIKKHIQRTYVTANGKSYEYPQCFYDNTYKEFFALGKGFPIDSTTKVTIPKMNFDIIDTLTDGTPGRDTLSYNIEINKVADKYGTFHAASMSFSLTDGGMLKNGKITYATIDAAHANAAVTVNDIVSGQVDYKTGNVSLSSASGDITGVYFTGTLSNEYNERSVSIEYKREEKEWKIEDGFRMNVPYSIEELEDAKALLDIDLYKKTYDNLAEIQTQVEDSGIIDFLDTEFDKYASLDLTDAITLGFESFTKTKEFDCDHTTYDTVALPSEFIERQLKYSIERFVIDIADTAKTDDVTFVLYGNPKYVSLLGDAVNWVVRSGDTLGGIKLNYSYGVMNTANVKIQVVSAAKISANNNSTLRLIPFPMSEDKFTFKHYKWTSHILTTQNSGYKDSSRPGGSMTNLMAVTRCKTVAIQGIQGKLKLLNPAKADI